MTSFSFPPEYQLPPFFLLQKGEKTKKAQIEVWKKLICDYCKAKKVGKFELKTAVESEPFSNKAIHRSLSVEDLRLIFDSLAKTGNAMWIDADKKTQVYVFWKPLEEWITYTINFAKEYKKFSNTFTVYSLVNDNHPPFNDFRFLSEQEVMIILKEMEKRNLCRLISDRDGNFSGVYFP